METELFAWDHMYECDGFTVYYNPRLLVDIDCFPMGKIFHEAHISDSGRLSFWDSRQQVAEFKIHIRVGKRIE